MTKSLTSQQLADLTESKLIGNPHLVIEDVADIDIAKPHHASFLSNPLYTKSLQTTQAGVVFVDSKTHLPEGKTVLIAQNPSLAFQKAILFYKGGIPRTGFNGIHSTAVIHPTAKIGENVQVGPHAVIDDNAEIGNGSIIGSGSYIGPYTKVGRDCLLHPRVIVRENCTVGNRVILQPGCVVGSCGFGFALNAKGEHEKLEQLGDVIIEDDVEIGANSTIDRARFGSTVIGKGTKIDNLVQIAHAVELGPHNIIVSQTGIAGSTKTGKYVVIGGQSAIAGHLKLDDGVMIAARSGVSKSLKTGKYNGVPAVPLDEYNKNSVLLRNMEKFVERIKKLEAQIQKLPS